MRIIKFKPADSLEFKNYIDIGSCERDYYCINFYLPGDNESSSGKRYFDSYNSWFENFKLESIGSKMIIVQFYLREYMGCNTSENTPQLDYFADVYGEKTATVMSSNLDYFLQFNNQWFEDEYILFNGLDLSWDDIEERFVSTKEDEDGILTEIELDDGSTISFIDQDDTIRSFYVAEEDFPELKNEIDRIVSKFQP
jgi:hypothetical protein